MNGCCPKCLKASTQPPSNKIPVLSITAACVISSRLTSPTFQKIYKISSVFLHLPGSVSQCIIKPPNPGFPFTDQHATTTSKMIYTTHFRGLFTFSAQGS